MPDQTVPDSDESSSMESTTDSQQQPSQSSAKPSGQLSYQQRGALIRHTNPPIASLPEAERKQVLQYAMERAYQDKRLKDVAEELGVSRTGLNQALLKYCADEWQEMQVARAMVNLEDAEIDLEKADNMPAVSRAGHRLRSAQWQLEKLHRRLFGEEQANRLGSGTVHINISMHRQPDSNDHAQVIDIKPDQQAE